MRSRMMLAMMMMMFIDSGERVSGNVGNANSVKEDSCHQYVDDDGITVIQLGQILSTTHKSKTTTSTSLIDKNFLPRMLHMDSY